MFAKVEMLKVFRNVIQYESSKLFNYEFVTIKQVDTKLMKKARGLILAKFANLSCNNDIIYKYTHSNCKTSIIDMPSQNCSCIYMFDHGICAHLIRIAIIEEIALPGMVAHTRLINKRREKAEKEVNLNVESDDEFATNINAIESQAINEIVNNLPIQSSQTAVENVELPKKKRGRKKKEQLPRALEKSPEIKSVRRSQRNKK